LQILQATKPHTGTAPTGEMFRARLDEQLNVQRTLIVSVRRTHLENAVRGDNDRIHEIKWSIFGLRQHG